MNHAHVAVVKNINNVVENKMDILNIKEKIKEKRKDCYIELLNWWGHEFARIFRNNNYKK